MLRICKDGKRKYVSLGISVNASFWNFQKGIPKRTCPNRDTIEKLIETKTREYKDMALDLDARKKSFTAHSLAAKIETTSHFYTVGEMYDQLICDFKRKSKVGNATIYADSKRFLQRFTKGSLSIPFDDIDYNWLVRYEEWMRAFCKETTISLQLRTLRSVFNKAIRLGVAKKESYPFDSYKISKFDTSTKKRAIGKDEIKRIEGLDLSSESWHMQFSRDLFLFSYYCAGMAISDIALLKFSQIKNDRLTYTRHKTASISRQKKEICFALSEKAKSIIQTYSTSSKPDDCYVFPILDKHKHRTEQQRKNRIHKVIGKVNSCLQSIGEKAGVGSHLTTYVARHTFATTMKRSHVNIALIAELMGHTNIITTQIYLDSFEDRQIDEAMQCLL